MSTGQQILICWPVLLNVNTASHGGKLASLVPEGVSLRSTGGSHPLSRSAINKEHGCREEGEKGAAMMPIYGYSGSICVDIKKSPIHMQIRT